MEIQDEYLLKKLMPSKNNIKCLTTFFYAFSDDTRLNIIILLTIKPLCVGDISKILNQNQTTISHQLKILKAHNIVSADRSGKNIILNATVECI